MLSFMQKHFFPFMQKGEKNGLITHKSMSLDAASHACILVAMVISCIVTLHISMDI